MNDPRIELRNSLIDNGFSFKDANIIALDAGSSQVYVDSNYFKDYHFTQSQINIALKLVSDFYSGKFYYSLDK